MYATKLKFWTGTRTQSISWHYKNKNQPHSILSWPFLDQTSSMQAKNTTSPPLIQEEDIYMMCPFKLIFCPRYCQSHDTTEIKYTINKNQQETTFNFHGPKLVGPSQNYPNLFHSWKWKGWKKRSFQIQFLYVQDMVNLISHEKIKKKLEEPIS